MAGTKWWFSKPSPDRLVGASLAAGPCTVLAGLAEFASTNMTTGERSYELVFKCIMPAEAAATKSSCRSRPSGMAAVRTDRASRFLSGRLDVDFSIRPGSHSVFDSPPTFDAPRTLAG